MAKDLLGTLVVVVLKARNLNDRHSFYKQDVFSKVSINGVTKTTPVDVKGGQHPVWDAEIRFPIMIEDSEKHRTLEVSCWSKEPRTEEILGQGKVNIAETLRTGEFDDWVPLETNGVSRGELYLEMTYYAAAPAPTSSPSLAPLNIGLARRPSKLPSADRLARQKQPSYPTSPPKSSSSSGSSLHPDRQYTQAPISPQGSHLLLPSSSPASSRSSSSSPKGRDAPLPSVPEDSPLKSNVPNVLTPGSGLKTSPKQVPSVPSILRPGNPNSSSTPTPQPLSKDTLSPLHSYSPPSSYSPQPYAAPRPAPHNPTFPPPPTQNPSRLFSAPPALWTEEPLSASKPPSFPQATLPPAREPFEYNYTPAYRGPPPPVRYQNTGDLPDPYLAVRYQTPLPLPGSPPRGRPSLSDERIQTLRLAEEEAARRRAQEEQDLELARQLDRELNLGDLQSARERAAASNVRPVNGGMPGGW